MNSLFELLTKIESENWSGEIGVSSSQGNATILIKEGQFIWAHRPLERAIEKLEKIPWITLPPETLIRSSKSWEGLVKLLLQANESSYNQVVRFLKTDRLELFFRLFFWSNVEFSPRPFHVETPDPAELGFYSPRKFSILLKEAKTRIDEWPEIQAKLGSSKRLFICRVDLPPRTEVGKDVIDDAFPDAKDTNNATLPFSYEEIEILRACDGTKTVQDLVRDSVDGEFLTLRRLINLWEKGAVSPKDDDSFRTTARHLKTKSIRVKEGALALLACTGVAFIFLLLHAFQLYFVPKYTSMVPLQQTLEIFKLRNDRYPLTLQEIDALQKLPPSYREKFQYQLIHPLEYKLMVK